ncbi:MULTISPECIES: 4-hydroxy-tetrahydrodipicolinate synthase [Rickettsieae]|uniref:4-hydroxy-tetrahydrodipicolinate synthase n=1 Tax=Rickettsieae TaxID=33988 RepID=UPI000B9B0B41|nr:4-hydroxy-tetrahydrodipicolinate synthase [Rickettsia endosymbiont of Culicoides newsteadi]OZG31575.1 4-hydroxy-tetrahydrodipicolinate synthase [Rickettsia endosymbiont of Culicoides newsteadi]
MENNIFKGVITAMITPFKENKLDFASVEKIVNYQIANKVDGIVVAGSTGEGPSLALQEYQSLLQAVIEITNKRIPVIAGCSAMTTSTAVDMVQICTKIAVDGFMCSIPSYVKPTQEGIYWHFETIHNASNLPIMLYSVPSRTLADFSDDTIIKLSKLPRIVALKDAGNDLERPLRIRSMVKDFSLLCGNDELALSYNAHSGVGCVSVASNITPSLCKKLQDNCRDGNYQEALQIQQQLLPIYKALFAESNPIPVKYAAARLGLCANELRLPLTSASVATEEKINKAMEYVGI